MKFCKYCGAQLESDSQFCPNCGRKVNNQPAPKLKSHSMTKQRKLLTGIGILIIVFALAGFGWWKYQHPSLQKAVTGSIYQCTISGEIGGKDTDGTMNTYLAFANDGHHLAGTVKKKDIKQFETYDFDTALHKIDYDKLTYSINNKEFTMYDDNSVDSKFNIVKYNRSSVQARLKSSNDSDFNDDKLQFKLTKIGEVK